MKYAKEDKEFVSKGKGIGYYNCYCEKYSSNTEEFENHNEFCGQYLYDFNMKKYFSIFCSVILNIINVILEIYNKKLIEKIGYKTQSA